MRENLFMTSSRRGVVGGGGVDNVINVVWKYSTTEIELNAL